MGERDWRARYKDARHYADDAANDLLRGYEVEGWRQVSETDQRRETLTGADWVVWLYEIALELAQTLVSVHGKQYQWCIDDCQRLIERCKSWPNNEVEEQPAHNVYEAGWGKIPPE